MVSPNRQQHFFLNGESSPEEGTDMKNVLIAMEKLRESLTVAGCHGGCEVKVPRPTLERLVAFAPLTFGRLEVPPDGTTPLAFATPAGVVLISEFESSLVDA
jgi:hypothetical protein